MKRLIIIIACFILYCLANGSARGDGEQTNLRFSPAELKIIARLANLSAPPADPTNSFADNARAVTFGQYIFFDARFSKNRQISCASCHKPQTGWADPQRFSQGLGAISRHTPSLWNTVYNRWYFWDGRADSLWAQALSPLENQNEMGLSRLQIARLIYQDEPLSTAYQNVFGKLPELNDEHRFPAAGGPNDPDPNRQKSWQAMSADDQLAINRVFANVGKALAAFERRIVSKDAPFDQFAAGLQAHDESAQRALSLKAQRGLQLFIGKAQCLSCHNGPNFSDGQFHNTGLGKDGKFPDRGRYDGIGIVTSDPFNAAGPFSDAPQSPTADKLRFVAQNANNWGAFKTPTLRNVAETAPYMHDGRFATLTEVIRYYSTLQNAIKPAQSGEQVLQPLNLSDEEIDELIAFLQSLTGKPLDTQLTRMPTAP